MGSKVIDIERILRETFVVRVEHHPTIGSTNERAIECAANSTGELPLLIVADRQTAGRGRGANRWWTGPGALAFSLLLDNQTSGRSPLAALAAAVAVVEAVAPFLPAHQVGLHWPNDVMADCRKLAGILIEVLPDRRHVVGIGLNANNSMTDAPEELQATAATLRELAGREFDLTELLINLLKRLERQWNRLHNEPQAVVARADELCLQRGRMLTISRGDSTSAGLCRGIAPDGALRLETPAGMETFYSGTVLQKTSHI